MRSSVRSNVVRSLCPHPVLVFTPLFTPSLFTPWFFCHLPCHLLGCRLALVENWFSSQYARARETTLFNSVRKIRIISPGNYATLRKCRFRRCYKKQKRDNADFADYKRTGNSFYSCRKFRTFSIHARPWRISPYRKKVFIKLKSYWTRPKLKHLFYEHLKNYWTGAFINGRLWTGARISYNHKKLFFLFILLHQLQHLRVLITTRARIYPLLNSTTPFYTSEYKSPFTFQT